MTRLFYIPLVVLGVAFLLLCADHGTLWPWNIVVHEDGRHTLLQTIFYFEHALGELPLDLLLAAAIAGAVPRAKEHTGWKLETIAATCIILDLVIVLGAWTGAGGKAALWYALQFHTRDDAPMIYGSHWRYHLLSQAALMLLPLALLPAGRDKRRNTLWISAWAIFAVLTIVFGMNKDSFIDPRYLGHQARELFTHGLVTAPLAIAVLCGRVTGFNWKPALAVALIAAYLGAGIILTGAQYHPQSADWTSVICAHLFEHTFSYLVVPAHAVLFHHLGVRQT